MLLEVFSALKAILGIVAAVFLYGWPLLVLIGVLAELAVFANNVDKLVSTSKVARLDPSFSIVEPIGALLAVAVAVLLLLLPHSLKKLGRYLLKRWKQSS